MKVFSGGGRTVSVVQADRFSWQRVNALKSLLFRHSTLPNGPLIILKQSVFVFHSREGLMMRLSCHLICIRTVQNSSNGGAPDSLIFLPVPRELTLTKSSW